MRRPWCLSSFEHVQKPEVLELEARVLGTTVRGREHEDGRMTTQQDMVSGISEHASKQLQPPRWEAAHS